jgi:hypothetical protein
MKKPTGPWLNFVRFLMSVQFERVAIVASASSGRRCHVIRREKIAGHIAGYAKVLKHGKRLFSWIWLTACGPRHLCQDADLVILCVPVGAW